MLISPSLRTKMVNFTISWSSNPHAADLYGWQHFFDLDDSCPTIHSVQDVPQFFLNKLCHNSFVIKFAIVD